MIQKPRQVAVEVASHSLDLLSHAAFTTLPFERPQDAVEASDVDSSTEIQGAVLHEIPLTSPKSLLNGCEIAWNC